MRIIVVLIILFIEFSFAQENGFKTYNHNDLGIQFQFDPNGDDVENPIEFCEPVDSLNDKKFFYSEKSFFKCKVPISYTVIINNTDSIFSIGYYKNISDTLNQNDFISLAKVYLSKDSFDQIANKEGFYFGKLSYDTTMQWLSTRGRSPAEPAQSLNGKKWKGLRGLTEMGRFDENGYAGISPVVSCFLMNYFDNNRAIVCSYRNGPETDFIDENIGDSPFFCESQFYDFVSSIKLQNSNK